ncbi:MAG TPA: hypothetical protein P5275_19170 [Saprospiraceae bacterium]|nr:hypothetical protein [Saprospiraceae bacterium]MCB9269787.1 hypothetical protein [Lewinellaceae bacterium]HPG06671.1 hypothetical protein [Saprospiraceae bacterium]HPR00346.1 hypothetical protein [Saprospiraceae bacterium]HRV87003.1 hypothetical protein [Saprospiraceae bacterium]
MKIVQAAQAVLQDALIYLRQIDRHTYALPIPLLSNSTIGQHTRHFIEFYQCLLSQSQPGTINYDLRRREKSIEEDPAVAAQQIVEIMLELQEQDWVKSCSIEADYSLGQPKGILIPTSLERELMYNIEHTIHHLALIKVGLKLVYPDLDLPNHFGVAPSTIKFQQAQLQDERVVVQ